MGSILFFCFYGCQKAKIVLSYKSGSIKRVISVIISIVKEQRDDGSRLIVELSSF